MTASAQQSLDAETETETETETLIAVAHALRGEGFDASEDGTGRGTPIVPIAFQHNASGANFHADHGVTGTLRASGGGGGNMPAIAFDPNQVTSKTNRSQPRGDVLHTMPAASEPPHLATPYAVRRLTPTEAERLMGFPDGYTATPHRGKPAADGPRYKALGNSWATNCAEWIGERIAEVDTWGGAAVERMEMTR